MKTKFNRIALIPFHCTDCHRYIWLEKYRKAEVWTNLPPCCPSSVKKKICKDCLKKYDIGRKRGTGMSNKYLDIAMEKVIKQEVNTVLNKIKSEIAEYKDDKVIHDERNEMIDIVLEIIDKYREPQESEPGMSEEISREEIAALLARESEEQE